MLRLPVGIQPVPSTRTPLNSPPSRRRAWLLGAYVALLHVALVAVCLKTNFRTLSAKTLGLEPPAERSVGLYQALLPWAGLGRDITPGAVAVVGDSIVKDLDPAGIGEGAVVLGAGGATVQVLREALGMLGPLANAEWLVMCAGVNDLKYRSPAEVLPDYMALLAGLPDGPRVLCLSILPVDEEVPDSMGRSFISNDEIAEFNRLLEAALEGSQQFQFADVQGIVETPRGEAPAVETAGGTDQRIHGPYQMDGWHLSREGRTRLEIAIRDRISGSPR